MKIIFILSAVLGLTACGNSDGATASSQGSTKSNTTPNAHITQLYESSCMACHERGVSGAPQSGKDSDWEARLAKGQEILVNNTVNGYLGMPPKGMCFKCSRKEISQLITYMAKERPLAKPVVVESQSTQPSRSSNQSNHSAQTNCNMTGGNYALNNYCRTGSCNGFSNNHALWNLCENSSPNGYAQGNEAIWRYLELGHTSAFTGAKLTGAKSCNSTFENRKRFIIYSSQGFTLTCR